MSSPLHRPLCIYSSSSTFALPLALLVVCAAHAGEHANDKFVRFGYNASVCSHDLSTLLQIPGGVQDITYRVRVRPIPPLVALSKKFNGTEDSYHMDNNSWENNTEPRVTGVHFNAVGDLSSFLTSLSINCATMAVFLLVFSYLRVRFPIMYSGRDDKQATALTTAVTSGMREICVEDASIFDQGTLSIIVSEQEDTVEDVRAIVSVPCCEYGPGTIVVDRPFERSFPQGSVVLFQPKDSMYNNVDHESLFGWFHASWKLTITDITDAAGLDHAQLIEFSYLAMKILGTLAVPLCVVLGPLHCFFGGGAAQQDHLSYWGAANVVEKHPWMYSVHAAVVWLVMLITERFVFGSQREFLRRRKRWLHRLPTPRCTTVLVERIPNGTDGRSLRHDFFYTDQGLKEFFDIHIFGREVVDSASIVRNTARLSTMIQARKLLELKRERLAVEVKSRDGAHLKDKLANVQASCDEKDTRITVERARIVDMVAQIEAQRVKDLAEAIGEDDTFDEPGTLLKKFRSPITNKLLHGESVLCSSGFVTFKSRRDAELALGMLAVANEEEFVISIPPDPADIIYSDLQVDPENQDGEDVVGYLCIAGVFWAYVPFVVGITQITSLKALGQQIAFFAHFADSTATVALWDGMMASLALTLFMSFVPTLFVLIFNAFFQLKAKAWLQYRVQQWYFYFLMLYVVLVTALGNSVTETFSRLVQSPGQTFTTLAATMPRATHFYLTYLPMQWVSHCQNAVRIPQLGKYNMFKRVFGKSSVEAKNFAEPEDQDYYGIGSRSARFALLLCLCIVFSILTPLITVLGFLNFALCRTIYGYLMVFAETKKPDLGGYFWVAQLLHVQQGMFVFLTLMTGVLYMRASTKIPAMVAGSCFVYHILSYRRFQRIFKWEHLAMCDVGDDLEKARRKSASTGVYQQPELVEDIEKLVRQKSKPLPGSTSMLVQMGIQHTKRKGAESVEAAAEGLANVSVVASDAVVKTMETASAITAMGATSAYSSASAGVGTVSEVASDVVANALGAASAITTYGASVTYSGVSAGLATVAEATSDAGSTSTKTSRESSSDWHAEAADSK